MSYSTSLTAGNSARASSEDQAAIHPIDTWFSKFESEPHSTSHVELCGYVVIELDRKADWSPDLTELMTRAAKLLGFGYARYAADLQKSRPSLNM